VHWKNRIISETVPDRDVSTGYKWEVILVWKVICILQAFSNAIFCIYGTSYGPSLCA